MAATSEQIDVRARAIAVLAALDDLQGYLTVSINPDRIALSDLEMEPMGWTKRPYSTKAFEVWRKQLDLFRADPLTVHHMAIMHHARAFDLEAGPKPGESDADWQAAMKYWHELYRSDAFWEQLTAKSCAGTNRQDDVRKLRQSLPQLLLAIHYDIALDKDTRDKRKARAKFHIAMAHKAPFDDQYRAEAQRSAYNQYIKCVPDDVWQPNELREEVLEVGQKAIVEYLNYDPGCVPALEDALRLQRRVQRSRNTAWQALSQGDPKRKALLALEKKDAEVWRPFFDQLAARADALDPDVREDLARWYHGRGGDLCAMDLEVNAIDFYERALTICEPESDLRRQYQRDVVRTHAYIAREKAVNEAQDARAHCERVRKRQDLTATACYLLAQAYVRMSLFDDAGGVCQQGLAIEPDFDDLDADDCAQRLKELLQQIPVVKLTRIATEAMQAGQLQKGLEALNDAERHAAAAGIAGEHNTIYWLRAQANLGLDRFQDARRDLQRYKVGLTKGEAESELRTIRQLEEMIAAKEEVGNVKPLLEKARRAMEDGRFKDALSPLNEAAKKVPKNDVVYFLRSQAHAALGDFQEARKDAKRVADLAESQDDRETARQLQEAIAEAERSAAANSLIDRARSSMEAGRFSDALPRLNEAAEKAPKNAIVYILRCQAHLGEGNLELARRDARRVGELSDAKEARDAVRQLNELITQADRSLAELGGPQARRLRDQAIDAFNRDRYPDAIKLMRQALDSSKGTGMREGAAKLRVELSAMLTGAAIDLANSAQQGVGGGMTRATLSALRNSMNEVARMLDEAMQLDPKNTKAAESRAQVSQILNQLP